MIAFASPAASGCPSIGVLLLGAAHTTETRAVLATLEQFVPDKLMRSVRTVSDAVDLVLREHWYPDLGVVLQSWPEEFARRDVNRLVELLPLTRWICCQGAWCESQGRTRSVWPVALCVPARDAGARIRRELSVLGGTRPPLPLTAARDEVYEFQTADKLPTTCLPLLVHVDSPDRELGRCWRDLLTGAGHRVWSSGGNPPPDVVLYDADPPGPETLRRLRTLTEACPEAGIVAVAAMAHAEDVADLQSAGASAVVAKLTDRHTLLHAVRLAVRGLRTAPGTWPVPGF